MAIVISTQALSIAFGLGLPALTYLYLFFLTHPRWIRAAPPPKEGEEPTPPQSVPPALAGLFFDGRFGEPEIAATIVDLMLREYLGVVDKRDKILILRLKPTQDLPFFERTIANHLLSRGTVVKSEVEIERRMNRQLYDEHVSEAIRSVFREGVKHKVFFEDPNSRYAWYYLTGLVIFFLGIVGFALLLPFFGELPMLLFYPMGLLLTATLIISRSKFIAAFSKSGRLIQEVWHDYREELRSYQPSLRQDIFFKYLPYAFALEVEGEWASRYRALPFAQPVWFTTYQTPNQEEFVKTLGQVVFALAKVLFAVRDPALKD